MKKRKTRSAPNVSGRYVAAMKCTQRIEKGENMTTDFKDRYELMQRLNNRPPTLQEIDDWEQVSYLEQWRIDNAGKPNIFGYVATIGLIAIGLGFAVKSCVLTPVPAASQLNCVECHTGVAKQRAKIAAYLHKNGVDKPAQVATAVMQTKRPKLMAAMAVKESPTGKAGDGGQSKGYFQVKEKHWRHLLHEGKVSDDPVVQALDSQRILDALVEEKGSLRKGLEAYGGSTTGKYSAMLLREMQRVKL